MKKHLLFFAALLGIFVTSCKQQDVATATTADPLVLAVEASAARTAALGDDVTKTKCQGKLTSVDPATLPAAILTYISTNYAGSNIKFAGKDDKGQYVVGVNLNGVGIGLLFDATGKFLQKLEKFHEKSKLTEVEVTALPATVTAYISKNYAGYTAKKAGKDADGNLLVGITNGTDFKVLKFDSAGVFKEELPVPPHDKGGKDGKGGPGGR